MSNEEKKKIILKLLAKHIKELRGKQSQFMLCSENDISTSILSLVERALKDPQFTTLFRIASALNIKTWELVKLVEDELGEDFSFIEL